MKRILALLLVILSVLSLFGCSAKSKADVQVYTVEEKVDSATVNQWKTLYLLDEDNYTITVCTLDPLDGKTVTTDFFMSGKYTKNSDSTVTIHAGYGYAEMLHGDIPVKTQILPDANGNMYNLYWELFSEVDTFTLNKNGTFTGA